MKPHFHLRGQRGTDAVRTSIYINIYLAADAVLFEGEVTANTALRQRLMLLEMKYLI